MCSSDLPVSFRYSVEITGRCCSGLIISIKSRKPNLAASHIPAGLDSSFGTTSDSTGTLFTCTGLDACGATGGNIDTRETTCIQKQKQAASQSHFTLKSITYITTIRAEWIIIPLDRHMLSTKQATKFQLRAFS